MENFIFCVVCKKANEFQLFATFKKRFITDVWQGLKSTSGILIYFRYLLRKMP